MIKIETQIFYISKNTKNFKIAKKFFFNKMNNKKFCYKKNLVLITFGIV